MGILLILLQVMLVVLQFAAHVIDINLWLLFMPAVLFGAIWALAVLMGSTFVVDSFKGIFR